MIRDKVYSSNSRTEGVTRRVVFRRDAFVLVKKKTIFIAIRKYGEYELNP
jgi:hypothetical protein